MSDENDNGVLSPDNSNQGGDDGVLNPEGGPDNGAAPAASDPADHWSNELPETFREGMAEVESWDDVTKALAGPEIPEQYVAPEGVEVDAELFQSFGEMARESQFTQPQVDGLLTFHDKLMREMPGKMLTMANENNLQELSKMESELGNERFTALKASAVTTLNHFADDGTRAFIESHGLKNSPQFIQLLARIGKGLSEDTFGGGGDPAPEAQDISQRMFGDMFEKK